jgi:two-component system phosphate regulon sensor histidine kinase PhoR
MWPAAARMVMGSAGPHHTDNARTLRASLFVLTPGLFLVLITGAILWLGFRATREWQRSTLVSVERRGNEVLVLLSAALDYDMKGAQTFLLSINEPMLNLDPPYDLADRFARAFARFPYPEYFFAWKSTRDGAGDTYFFMRSDRFPSWAPVDREDDTFPVVIRRDPEPLRPLIEAARLQAVAGTPFAFFESEIGGARYQTVLHFLYDGPSPRLYGLVGFSVNLTWVREHYFGELIAQIERIGGGQNAIGIEILDNTGQLVVGAGPIAAGDSRFTRNFPLVFADRALLSSLPRTLRTGREWTSRVTVANDPSLLAASRGATRTLSLLAIAALVTIGALALIVRANREAALLAEMKADFVSNVTHELKTPLAFIRLTSDTLAKRRYSSPAMIEEYATMLAIKAQQLTQLIDNVLNYARVSDARAAYAFEPLDVAELVEDSLERFHPQLAELGFDVQVRLPVDLPRIQADRAMMEHVLDNLVDNAIKYGDSGRALMVRGEAREGRVVIELADDGDGIEPDEVERVFEKFYRGRTAKQRGTGLGLAIVERIVRDHGGRVAIRSTIGVGTTVEISIPASSAV